MKAHLAQLWPTSGQVTTHIWPSYGSHLAQLRHTSGPATAPIWPSYGTHMAQLRHTSVLVVAAFWADALQDPLIHFSLDNIIKKK